MFAPLMLPLVLPALEPIITVLYLFCIFSLQLWRSPRLADLVVNYNMVSDWDVIFD